VQCLLPIIKTVLDHIDSSQSASGRLANLEVLINAVLYNPAAALQLMEQYRAGAARVFFDKWFFAIASDQRLPRVHDKKLTIMALCALMEMEPSAIPESLSDGWPGIVGGVVKVFKALPQAVTARKMLQDSLQEDDDDEDDGEEDPKFLAATGDDGQFHSLST